MDKAKYKVVRERYRATEAGQAAYSAADLTRRATNRALIAQARTGPCADCGRGDLPEEAMELDHVPGRGEPIRYRNGRRKSLLSMVTGGRRALEAELAKCDRVCPTCHKLRTLTRNQYHRKTDGEG